MAANIINYIGKKLIFYIIKKNIDLLELILYLYTVIHFYYMKTSEKTHLLKNEFKIDSWDLYYTFNDGSYFFGALTITNQRIFFETKVEGAIQAMLKASASLTNHTVNHIFLSKKLITHIEAVKDTTGNKVVITLTNGEKHIFDRKMLSTAKIITALQTM